MSQTSFSETTGQSSNWQNKEKKEALEENTMGSDLNSSEPFGES